MIETVQPDRGTRNTPAVQAKPVLLWTVLLLAGTVWGVTFSLARIAVHGGAHPIGLNFWQSILGCLFLAVFLILRGRRLPLTRRHLVFYSVCGFFGTALPGVCYFYAAVHVSAGVLSITIATVPMLSLVLALVFGIERPVLLRTVGLLLGICAVLLIVLPESSLPDPSVVPWVMLGFACACCYAIENTYIALRMPEGSDPVTVLCGMMAVATVMTAIVASLTGSFFMPAFPPTAVELSVLGMAAINAAAYAMFVYLIAAAGPVFASQMGYVVTLSGVAWGIILFGEQHSVWIWSALILLLAGMALVKPR